MRPGYSSNNSLVTVVVLLLATTLTTLSMELGHQVHQQLSSTHQALEDGAHRAGTVHDAEEQPVADVYAKDKEDDVSYSNVGRVRKHEIGTNDTLDDQGGKNASETHQEKETIESVNGNDGKNTNKRKQELENPPNDKHSSSTDELEMEEGVSRSEASNGRCEGSISPGREHKVVCNDISFTASLLMDIRDALYREKNTQDNQDSRDSLGQRLDDLRDETKDSIDRISSNFHRLQQDMDQKVSLVLETFSTLKLLVLSQGDQVRALLERLQVVKDQTESFQAQVDGFQRSLEEVKNNLRSQTTKLEISSRYGDNSFTEDGILDININGTDYGDRIKETKPKLDDLTSQVRDIAAAVTSMRAELEEVKEITDHTAVNKTVSTQQSQTGSRTSVTDSPSCQCSSDELKESITKLEELEIENRNKLVDIAKNLTRMEDQQRHASNRTWTYSHRLGQVESSHTDMHAMKIRVNALEEDLSNLKDELGRTTNLEDSSVDVTTDSSTKEGLCVWPYRRGGGGCYYVHTEERLTWHGAREHCRSLQGDLAAPSNYSQFKLFILKLRLSRAYTYWIGASDVGTNGKWMWIDGRPVTSDVWGSSQPEELNASCMALKPAYKFVASAEECRESRFFICQQERQL